MRGSNPEQLTRSVLADGARRVHAFGGGAPAPWERSAYAVAWHRANGSRGLMNRAHRKAISHALATDPITFPTGTYADMIAVLAVPPVHALTRALRDLHMWDAARWGTR